MNIINGYEFKDVIALFLAPNLTGVKSLVKDG